MSEPPAEDLERKEKTEEKIEGGESKKNKYRKEKPWDNDPDLDKWKVDEFKPEDNPNGLCKESSFAVLFP
jgi:ribosomal RNA assembly protein